MPRCQHSFDVDNTVIIIHRRVMLGCTSYPQNCAGELSVALGQSPQYYVANQMNSIWTTAYQGIMLCNTIANFSSSPSNNCNASATSTYYAAGYCNSSLQVNILFETLTYYIDAMVYNFTADPTTFYTDGSPTNPWYYAMWR